jgi:hypothetical protein
VSGMAMATGILWMAFIFALLAIPGASLTETLRPGG